MVALPQSETVVLSASAIQQFSECRQKYLLERVIKRGPAGRQTPLEFGGAIDKGVRVLYAQNWDLEAAQKTFEENYEDDPEDRKRTREVGKIILQRYARAYRDQDLKIVEPGFAFRLNVAGFDVPVVIIGEIDAVVEMHGRVMPSERKTTSQLTADYMKRFWWDLQTGIYLMAAQKLISPKISAVHLDCMLVAKSDPSKLKSEPLLRDILEKDPEEVSYMRGRILQLIGEMLYAKKALEQGQDFYYENDQACTNYGGCKYLAHCRRSPRIREQIRQQDYVAYVKDAEAYRKFENCKEGEF